MDRPLSLPLVSFPAFYRPVKRAIDLVGAAVLLFLLSPALLLIALAVRLDSPGPTLYRRRVLGMGGKTFDAYKFRTMVVDADEVLKGMLRENPHLRQEFENGFKLKGDPRVTRLGRFLRRYSLDELPQLINVLKGEMSLVGPRIISPIEQAHYGDFLRERLSIRPGITGLWQVSGRNDLPYQERIALDAYYIRHYSLWLDLKIILKTIPAALKGKGAY